MGFRRSQIAVFLLMALGCGEMLAWSERPASAEPGESCGTCSAPDCGAGRRECVRTEMARTIDNARTDLGESRRAPCAAGSCAAARVQATDVQRNTTDVGTQYRERAEETQRADRDLLQAAQRLIQSAPPGLAKVTPADAQRFEQLFSTAQSVPSPADVQAIQHSKLREFAQEITDNRKFGLEMAGESAKYFQRADDAKKMLDALDQRDRRVSSIDEAPKGAAKGASRKGDGTDALRGGKSAGVAPGGRGGLDASGISSSPDDPVRAGGKDKGEKAAEATPPTGGSYGGNEAAAEFGAKLVPFSLDAELKKKAGASDGKLDSFLEFAINRADFSKEENPLAERFGLGGGDGQQGQGAVAEENGRDVTLFQRVRRYFHRHPNRVR